MKTARFSYTEHRKTLNDDEQTEKMHLKSRKISRARAEYVFCASSFSLSGGETVKLKNLVMNEYKRRYRPEKVRQNGRLSNIRLLIALWVHNFSVGELGIISGSFFYVREKTGIVETFDFKKEKNCNVNKEELQSTFT